MIGKNENSLITISLCGDIFISKRLPGSSYPGFDELYTFLHKHECRFANLETTIHKREGYPEAFPGGGYAMADPACLCDLKRMGLNIFNTANNHAMDYGHNGLLATIKYLTDLELPFAGTGRNLAEASKPAFFETSNGRIALLGVTSSFHDSSAAGPQNQDMQGRPGVAPLKHQAVYELSENHYKALLEVSRSIGINSYHEQAIKEGYLPRCENLKFGIYEFRKGVENRVHTAPNEKDLQRTIAAIADAKRQSDIVILSVHSHQFADGSKKNPPEFIKIFVRKCIDAGATIVVCHGPHVVRGIEVYNSGVVFYGLGNFIFQHEDVDYLPEEFYWKYGKTREQVTGVSEIMNNRSKNNTIGLCTQPDAWRSVMVSISCDLEYLEVRLFPIKIILEGRKGLKGLPVLTSDLSIIQEIKNLSIEFGTNIEMANANFGYIRISRI